MKAFIWFLIKKKYIYILIKDLDDQINLFSSHVFLSIYNLIKGLILSKNNQIKRSLDRIYLILNFIKID